MGKAFAKRRLVVAVFVAAFLAALFIPALAFADDSPSDSNATTTVKVGYYEARNFQEGAADDEPKSGYGYEYLQRMASYAGWHCEYTYGTWRELYEKLRTGEIDVLAGVSRSGGREGEVLFLTASMLNETFYLYKGVEDDSITGGSPASYAGKTIGVVGDTSSKLLFEAWMRESGYAATEKVYPSSDECKAAFEAGEVQAFVSADNIVHGMSDIQPADIVGREPYYLAVSKTRPDLLEQVNEVLPVMNSLDSGFLVDLQSRYAADTSVSAYLTSEERGWIDGHSSLTVGYLDNYLPYCSTNEDGSPTGLMVDVVPAMLDSLPSSWQPEITYRAFKSQTDLLSALDAGEVDLAFPVSGETWYAESAGYLRSSSVASPIMDLVVTEHYNPDTITDRIALNRNNLMQHNYAATYFPDAEIIECDSIEECFDAIKRGEANSTVVNGLRATALLGAEPKLVAIQLPESDDRCFGVASGNGPLLQLVNRGIDILGVDYCTNASYAYTKGLFKYTWQDFARDNWVSIACIAVLIIGIIALFALHRFQVLRKEAQREAQMNKHLEDALEKAEKANHAKDMLLRNLSHDIRTPLNGILGAMELNANDPSGANAKSSLAKARGASRQLVSLVDDLLEINQLRSGEAKAAEREFFLADSLNEVIEVESAFAQAADVHLELRELPRALQTVKVRGCADYLNKVLENIIDNAVRYNKANGQVVVRASLSEPSEGTVRFMCIVEDTGIGMSEEDLRRVYEPFFQADEGARSEYPGSGLGMSIVSDLLRLLGGTIEMSSVPGKGTAVSIEVPFAAARTECEPEPSHSVSDSVEGMKVLLVEDNELNREVTQCILEQMGVEVLLACNGKQAVEVFEASKPGSIDAVLMDVMMPVMNGIEAAKAIRATKRSDSDVPILATTAKVTEDDRRMVLGAGMNAHLSKPLEPERLRSALAAYRR